MNETHQIAIDVLILKITTNEINARTFNKELIKVILANDLYSEFKFK